MKQVGQRRNREEIAVQTVPGSAGVDTEVRFYRANEKPYGAFSNLFRRAITFEGREYPTAEHAYQAGKARKEKVREWILSAPSPALAAMAAHGLYSWDVVSNWAEIKHDRMRRVLRAKFQQHDDLRQLLLSTAEARLVEAGTVDNVVNRTWGVVNGKGQNMLGILLMELRAELFQAAKGGARVVIQQVQAPPKAVGNTRRVSQARSPRQSDRKTHGKHALRT